MIDILMSTYNGERFLSEQIDSILSQDHAEFRLHVRDDGSSDGTVEILNHYAARDERMILVIDDLGNLGAPASFFELIRGSDAALMMLADQDDVWIADKISRTLSRMQELADLYGVGRPLAVFTDLRVVDENLKIVADSFWAYQRLDPEISADWRSLLAQNVVTGCTLMFNAAARKVVLPFELPGMMHDHWIAAKVAKSGHIGYVAEPTVLYRQHDQNVEGARSAGLHYLLSKIPDASRSFSDLGKAARVFGNVSAASLRKRKIELNLKRLSSR